jgi:hypothetical protein
VLAGVDQQLRKPSGKAGLVAVGERVDQINAFTLGRAYHVHAENQAAVDRARDACPSPAKGLPS